MVAFCEYLYIEFIELNRINSRYYQSAQPCDKRIILDMDITNGRCIKY